MCGSFDTVIWGKTPKGIRRFKCKKCGKTFTFRKVKSGENSKYFSKFKKWICTGVTLSDLSDSSVSAKTLSRAFDCFLKKCPKPTKLTTPKQIHLKCDAKYFKRCSHECTLVFKEGTNIINWLYKDGERVQYYVAGLIELSSLGYEIRSVTSDKHGSIIAAVKWLLPDIPHQYCLVHIQNRCQSLLTKRPDTKEGQDLLRLVRMINKVKSKTDETVFRKWLENYGRENELFLKQISYAKKPNGATTWWYTHKRVRSAYRHILGSLDHMFLYLDDPDIPKDTNGLEAEFTHLKTKLNLHRGLSKTRRENFVNWYWYFKYKSSN